MKLSTCITKALEGNGVEYVFGMSAGTCSSLWDSINDTNIKPIISKMRLAHYMRLQIMQMHLIN